MSSKRQIGRAKVFHLQNYALITAENDFPAVLMGCLPFVRINRLGRALNNGMGFSKISKPTERNGAYHLHFDFP